MTLRRIVRILGNLAFSLSLVCLPGNSPVEAQRAARPNILIIMSDDMGFSDIGCYGGEIRTPSLDSLAANGLRFRQFYNNARCCPTRASVLTGLYPHQAGIGHMMTDRGHDGYRGDLNRNCLTIAEVLKSAGYTTWAVGKWHVTPGNTAAKLKRTHNWPLQRGFDRFYGTIHGAGSYYDPSSLVRDNKLITAFNDPEYQPADFYYTQALSDQAIRFIAEHKQRAGGAPFFMYLTYTAAHWPMHAPESAVAKYKGKYATGYEPVRRARWENAKRLGLIDPKWSLPPQAGNWSQVQNQGWEARLMEVYAGIVDNMDQGIGRIVEELRRQGELENTVIFYLQDNGGCAETMGRAPTEANPHTARPDKPTYPPMSKDDPQLSSVPKQTRAGYPVLMGTGATPGGPESYIAYGQGWANVSNTPFREYKHWVHEGGISTPLIVHWPQGIPASRNNSLVDDPGHLVDLMATCIDLSGAKYPTRRDGREIHPPEGVSLRPVFEGKPLQRKQPIFWEHEGNRAVRSGRWKLVAKENQPWELYDMESDRTEMNNLAAEYQAKVKELSAQWDAWASRAHVQPLGAWRAKAQ